MALVNEITVVPTGRQGIHQPVDCTASVVREGSGRKFIQLNTFGSADREFPGKQSQTVQLSETAAAQLKKLIEETFPNLV